MKVTLALLRAAVGYPLVAFGYTTMILGVLALEGTRGAQEFIRRFPNA